MHPYLLILFTGIPVPGLIVMSVRAVKVRRMAGGKGGGKYVAGIWIAYAATIGLCGHMANLFPNLSSAAVLLMLAGGFGICYVIAGIGVVRGRKTLTRGKEPKDGQL